MAVRPNSTTNLEYEVHFIEDHSVKVVNRNYFASEIMPHLKVKQQVKGILFEFYLTVVKTKKTVYILNCLPVSESKINRDDAWNRRLEVSQTLSKLFSIKQASATPFSATRSWKQSVIDVVIGTYSITFCNEISKDEILKISHVNSQKEIDHAIESFSKGEAYDSERYANLGVKDPRYSHIKHFAWLYWQIIQLIKHLITESPKQLTVVDLGVGNGHFILSAIKVLEQEGMKGRVKFIGIDNNQNSIDFARQLLTDQGIANVNLMHDDVTKPGFAKRLNCLKADLVVANHMLEHLPGELKNKYLHDWLVGSKHLLAISVPLGDELISSISNHYHFFDVEKVQALADSMEIRVGYAIETKNIDLTKYVGLMVFEKRKEVQKYGGFHGELVELFPDATDVDPSSYYDVFQKTFDPKEFQKAYRAPIVGTIKNKLLFAKKGDQPRQVRQLPIKMPNTSVQIPTEFMQFEEAIQLIINHNKAVNPDYDEYFAYLNIFRGMTKFDAYRGLSLNCHGDQLQGLNSEYWYNPDYSYIVSNTNPTSLYEQRFDFSEAIRKFKEGQHVNLYDFMNAQAEEKNRYFSENFSIYLLNPYVVHSATYIEKEVYRVFMKVAFSSKRFFDNRELRRNPAFDYKNWYYQETIGYTDGWLQHAHYNERFLKRDIIF